MYNYDKCIVILYNKQIADFVFADETDEEAIARAKKLYSKELRRVKQNYAELGEDYWRKESERYEHILLAGFQVMNYRAYKKSLVMDLLDCPPQEISEQDFEDVFNNLPPLRWETSNGVEMFCSAEAYDFTFHQQYAHDSISGKYYTKLVDIADRSTWINTMLRETA